MFFIQFLFYSLSYLFKFFRMFLIVRTFSLVVNPLLFPDWCFNFSSDQRYIPSQ